MTKGSVLELDQYILTSQYHHRYQVHRCIHILYKQKEIAEQLTAAINVLLVVFDDSVYCLIIKLLLLYYDYYYRSSFPCAIQLPKTIKTHHLATPLHSVTCSPITMNMKIMNRLHFVLTTMHEYVCRHLWFIDVELNHEHFCAVVCYYFLLPLLFLNSDFQATDSAKPNYYIIVD